MAINAPKGTRDMLPDEALYWNRFKGAAQEMFGRYGYVAIETPLMERTELFVRGIGEATDVVSKEMFNVISGENLNTLLAGGHISSSKRLSLRPEGTAGVVRSVVQNDLVPQGAPPAKLMYAGPMFRAEQPQEGRYRQFHQIGIECLGADEPTIDAEGIIMSMRFFADMGFEAGDLLLLVNSMGCDECRPAYRDKVREFGEAHRDELCDNCRQRLELNPLRMFDCKSEGCKAIMEAAPLISDHLCPDCASHYSQVLAMLDAAGIAYVEDSKLVRGLDYYTRTVFEIQDVSKGSAQSAICGGGRYDKLADEVKGQVKATSSLPGFGFAMGYERCKEALIRKGMELEPARRLSAFIACATDDARPVAFTLAQALRDAGVVCDFDHQSRSLKSQFKVADRLGSRFVVVLGTDEISQGVAKLRNMDTHEEELVAMESVPAYIKAAL